MMKNNQKMIAMGYDPKSRTLEIEFDNRVVKRGIPMMPAQFGYVAPTPVLMESK